MSTFYTERQGASQIGSCANGSSAYVTASGDLSFATGSVFLSRMRMTVPRYATINSAKVSFQIFAKNAATAQTIYTSFRAHASGDSPILTPGALEGQRPWTAARVEWNFSWTPNPVGDVIPQVDITSVVREVVNRADYQPGGYITLMMYCDNENGSDLSIRANNAFSPTMSLTTDYTENRAASDFVTSINLCANPHNESIPAIDATALPFWQQGNFFGAMVDVANQGTVARDTAFTRLSGAATLRFTAGTPPVETNKSTGPYSPVVAEVGKTYIFAGWIYIPSAVTSQVVCGDPYLGRSHTVTARDQWVPFCSTPTLPIAARGTFWPAARIMGPFQAGWQFWISEPTIMVSEYRQMPFNGYTPDIVDPGGSVLVDNKRLGSGQTAVKEWLPRTGVKRNGTLYRVPRYTKRPDGILQVSEPIKGGPQVPNLPATPIGGYPADQTIAEL